MDIVINLYLTKYITFTYNIFSVIYFMKNKQMVKIEDIQNMESIVEDSIKKIVPKKTVNFMINSESLYFNEKVSSLLRVFLASI